MELRPHQKKFLEKNPNRAILNHAPRTGKSLIMKLWSEDEIRNKSVVIICLKKNKDEWKTNCPHATVLTKEEVKKEWKNLINLTAIVVDEVHHFFSPLYVPRERSRQAETLFNIIQNNPDAHFLGVSGTPVTNNAASPHTMMTYLRVARPWKQYRDYFYELRRMPYLKKRAWIAKKEWRIWANEILHKYTDTVTLRDCMDYLPPEEHIIKTLKTKPYLYEPDEPQSWVKDHRAEQNGKHLIIEELGYRKAIIVAHYTEQVDDLAKQLSKTKNVYVLDGRTKDQAKTIKQAQDDTDCYLICQDAMGEGFDGYMFDALVFASMPYSYVHFTQMRERLTTLDPKHIKPKHYYYIISENGKWDKKIYKSLIEAKKSFSPPNEIYGTIT